MEAFYVDKIRELEVKVDRLENDNRDLLAEVEGLRISLQNCQSELKKQLAFNQKNVDAAVEEMSAKMVTKFGEEAAEYFKQAEKQKEALKADVYKEKAMRMRLEDELIALKEEKESLESFYYSLVENHRRLLKADIERNKASLHKSSTSASQLQTSSAKKTHYSAREEKEVLQT
jgi:predicted component of type VI protein secretion system